MGRPTIRVFAGIVAAGLSATAFAASAFAADLLPPPPLEEGHAPVAIGGGWYLRADIGVANYETDDWTQPPSDNGSTVISSGFIRNAIKGGAFVGAGVGYQFNPWLRADITGEYRSDVYAFGTYQESTTFFDASGLRNFAGQNNYTGDFKSLVFLANAYVDLGTWWGLTPFVGGGVGFARKELTDFSDSGYASLDGAVFPVAVNLIADSSKTDFAWALMAGLSYEVTPNLKLEVGYRYLNLGDAKSGNIYCGTLSGCNKVAEGFTVKNLEAQEVKLGMRWILGGPVYDQPIVRKY